MTTKFWIADEVNGPGRFPVAKLIRLAARTLSPDVAWLVTRARGYGLLVNELAGMLDTHDEVVMSTDELCSIADADDEWFYDLEAAASDGKLRIGVHDSARMFVQGQRRVAGEIAGAFDQVTEADD